jgi:hypothetical protein
MIFLHFKARSDKFVAAKKRRRKPTQKSCSSDHRTMRREKWIEFLNKLSAANNE